MWWRKYRSDSRDLTKVPHSRGDRRLQRYADYRWRSMRIGIGIALVMAVLLLLIRLPA